MIILLGETQEELGGTEYLAAIHRRKVGKPPRVDLAKERALQQLMIETTSRSWLKSAHDCSEGGLAVALAECCITDGEHLLGASIGESNIQPPKSKIRTDALLFGESAGRIIVTCERRHVEPIEGLAQRHGVALAIIGSVGGSRLRLDPWIEAPVEDLNDAWRTGLQRTL